MSVEVTMPRLSDSMEEGTVAKWLVEVGAEVRKGQPLVEIDTDKATIEYEAEIGGTLLEILAAEGDTVAIGEPIGRIGAAGAEVETAAPAAPPARAEPEPPAPAPPAASRRDGSRSGVSPVARRLADELGVDLATLAGTGPAGSITKADVERAAHRGGAAPEPAPPAADEQQLVEPTRLQRTVARRMVEAHAMPDFAAEVEVDMTQSLALRDRLAGAGGAKPSVNDLVVKAVALALRDEPRLNGSFTDEGFVVHSRINVGIAVATDDGLIVPTIFDADRKSLAEIGSESRELAGKVRDGTVTPAELDGGTFTVTNLGMFGVRRFFPIINPPQAAILAVGDVAKRPVVDDLGGVLARDVMSAIVVCDHRIVYGADAARFLARVRGLLEEPAQLDK